MSIEDDTHDPYERINIVPALSELSQQQIKEISDFIYKELPRRSPSGRFERIPLLLERLLFEYLANRNQLEAIKRAQLREEEEGT